jgi:Dehydratase large subunit
MGDAREPGDGAPLARVHDLRARAGRGATPGVTTARPPSLRLRRGRVVELDGRVAADFDATDAFLARHGIDLTVAPEAMALDAVTFGRMLVHPVAAAEDLARLATGMTPAQLTAALVGLRAGELAMAATKLRTLRDAWGDRPSGGEVLVMGPVEPDPEPEQGAPDRSPRETPWSTALRVSSYAARGLRSRIVTGGARSGGGYDALGHAVRRMVLARAMGAWGVALTRPDEADQRAAVEEVVALLLGLDARGRASTIGASRTGTPGDDFGSDAAGLRRRATLVADAGHPQLGTSLQRAAELVAFDDADVDRLCTSLRPAAAGVDVLEAEASGLQARAATSCAAFLLEAATVYAALGLSRPPPS